MATSSVSSCFTENLKVEMECVRAKSDAITETVEHTFDEEKIIRIASWNLKSTFSQRNDAKMDVIRRIIYLIEPDVIALQELASPGRDIIAAIKLGLVGNWKAKFIRHDIYRSNKCLAFLWNTSKIEDDETRSGDFVLSHGRYSLYRAFSLGKFKFKLVNFHLRPYNHKNHPFEIQRFHEVLDVTEEENWYSILVGDFNEYPCNDELKKRLYENVIGPHQYTNLIGTHCYDNLIVPYSLYLRCIGQEVCKDKLITQPYFDHYPVVANFYC